MSDTVEKILLQIELDVDKTKQSLIDTKNELDKFKTKLAEQNAELKLAKQLGQEGSVSYRNLQLSIIDTSAKVNALTKEQNAYQLAISKQVQADNAATGSLNQMRAALAAGQIIFAEFTEEQKKSDQGVIDFGNSLSVLKDKITEQATGIGSTVEKVGAYENATKSLKAQLREATLAAQEMTVKFGANSTEALNATKTVAGLKDSIDDFNKRVNALDPKSKFEAFGQVASSLAGGFAAAQGAMALFGGESEQVQQALLKVQAAMAFAQGIKQFMELGDAISNVRVILGLTTAMKEKDTAATVENTAATEGQAVATGAAAAGTEAMAVAEETATVATTGFGIAIKTLLITSGLVLLPLVVEAVVDAFHALSDAKFDVDIITNSIKGENDAHKLTIEQLKAKQQAYTTEAQNALDLAKAKGASETELAELQKKVIEENIAGIRKEGAENNEHLTQLEAQQAKFTDAALQKLSAGDLKKAQEAKKANAEEIQATVIKNTELLNQYTKLQNDIKVLAIDTQQKEIERLNNLAQLRIGLIKDARTQELKTEQEATAEKLQLLLRDETANAQEISLIRQQSAQKLKDISLKFDEKEQTERNQLKIALTREGTLERNAAEVAAEQASTALLLQNDRLTALERDLIQAQSAEKIRQLQEDRLKIVEQNNQREVELADQKQQALLAIEQAQAGGNLQAQLTLRLQQIQLNAQAEIEAKEKAGDESKALAQQQITDQQALSEAIKQIDENTAVQKFAITVQSYQDIKQATDEFQLQQLQDEADFLQLKSDTENVFSISKLDAKIAALNVSYEKEKQALTKKYSDANGITAKGEEALALLDKKYNKLKIDTTLDTTNEQLKAIGGGLDKAASLFSQNTAAYKIIASARAGINAWLAFTVDLKLGWPLGPILGAIDLASGLQAVQKIATYGFYEGGYTGRGNPRAESKQLGGRPYAYHYEEYMVPQRVLKTPQGAALVSSLEQMRTGGTSAMAGVKGFAEGGSTPSYVYVSQESSGPAYDQYATETAMIRAAQALPPPIVTVEDINAGQDRVATVVDRASI